MSAGQGISAVILAAGQSSRMRGEHKLLKSIHHKPVILWVAEDLCRLQFKEVLLISGERATEIESCVESLAVCCVHNGDYAQGMHSSIRAAIQSMDPESIGILVFLGDQPFHVWARAKLFFAREDISERSLIRSIAKDRPGHPVFIGRSYFPEILSHPDDDRGCGYLFQTHPFQTVEQADDCVWDLDTPEDFMRFEAPHQSS